MNPDFCRKQGAHFPNRYTPSKSSYTSSSYSMNPRYGPSTPIKTSTPSSHRLNANSVMTYPPTTRLPIQPSASSSQSMTGSWVQHVLSRIELTTPFRYTLEVQAISIFQNRRDGIGRIDLPWYAQLQLFSPSVIPFNCFTNQNRVAKLTGDPAT